MKIPVEWTLMFIGLCFFLGSCKDWFDDDDGPNFKGEVIADHLDTPWELAFAPDGRLFLTQRPGVIDVIENGNLKVWPALESVVEELGDPDFLALHCIRTSVKMDIYILPIPTPKVNPIEISK